MGGRSINLVSGFLYAEPSAVEGWARLIDFGDTLTEWNQSMTGEQADALALYADWRAVGFDFYSVLSRLTPSISRDPIVAQESAAK